MQKATPSEPVPRIGQLIYVERFLENGKLDYESICFIDEKPKKNQLWMYTQIAIIYNEDGKQIASFEDGAG